MQLLFIPSACFLEKDIISISHFTRPNPAPCVYTAVWTLDSLAPKPFPMHKQECSAMYIPYTHQKTSLPSCPMCSVIFGGETEFRKKSQCVLGRLGQPSGSFSHFLCTKQKRCTFRIHNKRSSSYFYSADTKFHNLQFLNFDGYFESCLELFFKPWGLKWEVTAMNKIISSVFALSISKVLTAKKKY